MLTKSRHTCGVLPALAFLLVLPAPQPASSGTGDVIGKVVDPDNKPVVGAAVTLTRRQSNGHNDSVTVTSGEDGAFRARGLAYGEWTFSVKAPGYYEKGKWEPAAGGAQRLRIHPSALLAPGADSQTVEIILRPVSILYGRVLTASGNLVSNQRIWFVRPRSAHFIVVHEPIRCDGSGYFYQSVNFEGEDQFGVFDEVSGNYLPVTKFTYVGGKRTRRDIRLVRGASVSGRVVAADGKTPVADASVYGEYDYFEGGSPVFRARVQSDFLSVDWPGAKTDADGAFCLPLNPGMNYRLHATGSTSAGTFHNSSHTAPKVRLRDGQQRNGIRLVLSEKMVAVRGGRGR